MKTSLRTLLVGLIAAVAVVLPLAYVEAEGVFLFEPVKRALLVSLGALLIVGIPLERWQSGRSLFPADRLEGLLVVLLAWLGIAGLFAGNGFLAAQAWFQWAAAAGAFVLVRRSDMRRHAAAAVLVGSALAAVVGYLQPAGYGPPLHDSAFAGRVAAGAFGSAQAAALSILPLALFGIGLLFQAGRGGRAVWFAPAAAALAVALPYLGMTRHRGAWFVIVGVAVLAALWLLVKAQWERRMTAAAVLAAIAVAVVGASVSGAPPELTSALDTRKASNGIRFAVWRDAGDLLEKAPVFGFGPGQFRIVLPDHWSEETAKQVMARVGERPEDPRSDVIGVGVAGGFPALLMLAAFLLIALRGGFTPRALTGAQAFDFAAGLAAAGLAAAMLVESVSAHPAAWLALFVLLAQIVPLNPGDEREGSRPRAALALAFVGLFAAWRAAPRAALAVRAELRARQAADYVNVHPARAFEMAVRAADDNPAEPLAFRVMGQATLNQGKPGSRDYSGAEDKLKRALALDPTDEVARFHLGVSMLERGLQRREDLQAARGEFEKVLAVNPYLSRAHFMLAVVDAQDRAPWIRVRLHLERALKLEPALWRAVSRMPEFEDYRARTAEWDAWSTGIRRLLRLE